MNIDINTKINISINVNMNINININISLPSKYQNFGEITFPEVTRKKYLLNYEYCLYFWRGGILMQVNKQLDWFLTTCLNGKWSI